jgi:uncharacterized protein
VRVVRHSDAKAFRHKVDDFLLRDEATHNVILGITSRMITTGEAYDDVFLAHVENDAGKVVAVTMRTVPHGPVLSNISDKAAISLLVDAFAEVYDSLPTVLGTPEDASQFAELWQKKSGQPFHIKMEQGIYKLEIVIPPQNIGGEARQATYDDFDLLVEWFLGFWLDAGLTASSEDEVRKNIERKLENPILGGIRFWCDDGQAISMAAATRESPNGGNVSLVYTPSEFRGRGYASAVTAAVSQAILDMGKQFCYLYTDLANPTSNKIYQAIGYEHVCKHRHIAFENRE